MGMFFINDEVFLNNGGAFIPAPELLQPPARTVDWEMENFEPEEPEHGLVCVQEKNTDDIEHTARARECYNPTKRWHFRWRDYRGSRGRKRGNGWNLKAERRSQARRY